MRQEDRSNLFRLRDMQLDLQKATRKANNLNLLQT
jgi:hypothetical protein